MQERSGHLQGLKVIDFSAVYAGPICARFLADNGADVIKVEPPVGGDVIRGPEGYSRVFVHFNAGKKSLALDLGQPEGQRIARALLKDADVLIENYRPGIMRRFGLDYSSLKEDFPSLVYCSISGYGQEGPRADWGAYAPVVHAASGFDQVFTASQHPAAERPPVWSIMIADMLTGAYANAALQTALLGRVRTGLGDYVDVTMLESMMMLIPAQLLFAQTEGMRPSGAFQPITTSDGYVMLCVVSNKNLQGICRALGAPEMAEDPRFQLGQRWMFMDNFISMVEAWSSDLTSAECEALLNREGVPCSRYNSPADLLTHPQLLHRQSFTEFNDKAGRFLLQRGPFRFAAGRSGPGLTAPALGQHSRELLNAACGIGDDEFDNLRAAGVVG